MTVVVPHDPDPDESAAKIVEEMIGKAVKVAAAQPAGIKMEELRILQSLAHPGLKPVEEIIPQ